MWPPASSTMQLFWYDTVHSLPPPFLFSFTPCMCGNGAAALWLIERECFTLTADSFYMCLTD